MTWRPRFKLRTLLIATAILGVFFGFLTSFLVRVHTAAQIVAKLEAQGGYLQYDWQIGNSDPKKSPNGWAPLRWIFGNDAFSSVVSVDFEPQSSKRFDLAQLHDLPELEYVTLRGQILTKLDVNQLATIKKLRDLRLHDADVTADGLACFSSMQNLTSLVLDGTTISDSTLQALDKLPALQYLSLYQTNITSQGLKYISGISSLKRLLINTDPAVGADGLEAISRLTGLEELELPSVTDETGLKHLRRLTNLRYLSLGKTPISAASLDDLRDLKNLEKLLVVIEDNQNTHLGVLQAFQKLQILVLYGSTITDTDLDDIAKIEGLQNLIIRRTPVADAGLSKLASLKNLKNLTVGPNVSEAAAQSFASRCRTARFLAGTPMAGRCSICRKAQGLSCLQTRPQVSPA